MRASVVWCGLFVALAAVPATAQDWTETFDMGNVGGWTFFAPGEAIVAGGNPGPHLRAPLLDTFAPQPQTSAAVSPFRGDYRAWGVESLGVDLITYSTQFPFDRELSLILTNDMNTVTTADDVSVYFLGTRRVPQVGEGFRSFDFFVDSQSATIPPGWAPLTPCGNPDVCWNQVITNVSKVTYFYGNPTFFFIFDQWDVGMDNPRISTSLPTTTYCVGKTNSQGCQASISLSGAPSASSTSPFLIDASDVISQTNGIFFYGHNGPDNLPFQGGTLCVAAPVTRTPVQFSNGNVTPDCSGTYSLDFNAYTQSGVDPNLVAGQLVFGQYWYRDAAAAIPSALTDAAMFEIQP